MSWQDRAVTPEEVASHVKMGHRVFVHGAAATPTPILEELGKRTDLEAVRLYHIHTAGDMPSTDPERGGRIRSISLFTGANMRKAVENGLADFVPIFLSDIPDLFRTRAVPLNVAILQLSPPDSHGFCTLGTSVDAARAAADAADLVVAEINMQMPRTHGHTVVPLSRLDAYCVSDRPLHEHAPGHESPVEARIGEIIADLVEDGSTLQMGIGAIPDAVLARLHNKHELGIHTEMFSDGLVPLVEGGVITNRHKSVHPGRVVTSFINGTKKLFDFVNDNPLVEFHPADRTNDTSLIRKNPKVVAINSAIEIDLTGQVCADSLGHQIFSGIGGQMDFIRGAALSAGGKPILALPSTAAKGRISRIATTLKAGAGVVTTRGHVHWVVTEYGAVNLHGKTLRERADLLISIAHPDFRAELRKEAYELRHFT
jgi:acyl-CoA hydrolase